MKEFFGSLLPTVLMAAALAFAIFHKPPIKPPVRIMVHDLAMGNVEWHMDDGIQPPNHIGEMPPIHERFSWGDTPVQVRCMMLWNLMDDTTHESGSACLKPDGKTWELEGLAKTNPVRFWQMAWRLGMGSGLRV